MKLPTRPEPGQHPGPILQKRAASVTGLVLLAHAALLWLVSQHAQVQTAASNKDGVIMASVVTDVPAAQAQPPVPARASARPQPMQTLASAQAMPVPSQNTAAATAAATAPAASTSTTAATSLPQAASASPAVAAVTLPSSDADYLQNPPPAYPRMSRRMGEQGTVIVRVLISTEGLAEQAEIRSTSGYARLDEAALATVRRWRYVPGKRAGSPEAMWFNVPIRFVLN